MHNLYANLVAVVTLAFATSQVQAYTYTVDPLLDGSLVLCSPCSSYPGSVAVTSGTEFQGLVRFKTPQNLLSTDRIELSLTLSALPSQSTQEAIYGYESYAIGINSSDKYAGTFLGNLYIQADALLGTSYQLDVTDFVKAASAPYISFNLRSTELNSFTSIGNRSTTPTQLWVSTIPEPATSGIFALGIVFGFALHRQRKAAL